MMSAPDASVGCQQVQRGPQYQRRRLPVPQISDSLQRSSDDLREVARPIDFDGSKAGSVRACEAGLGIFKSGSGLYAEPIGKEKVWSRRWLGRCGLTSKDHCIKPLEDSGGAQNRFDFGSF